MGAGFGVEPWVLQDAASGILDAVRDTDGSKVEPLRGSSEEYGHNALFGAVEELCSAVEIGVGVLVRNSEGIGDALHDAALNYVDSDDAANGAMAGALNDLADRSEGFH